MLARGQRQHVAVVLEQHEALQRRLVPDAQVQRRTDVLGAELRPLDSVDGVESPGTEQRAQRPCHCASDVCLARESVARGVCQPVQQQEAPHLEVGAVIYRPCRCDRIGRRVGRRPSHVLHGAAVGGDDGLAVVPLLAQHVVEQVPVRARGLPQWGVVCARATTSKSQAGGHA